MTDNLSQNKTKIANTLSPITDKISNISGYAKERFNNIKTRFTRRAPVNNDPLLSNHNNSSENTNSPSALSHLARVSEYKKISNQT